MGKKEFGRITVEGACGSCGEHFAPDIKVCPNDGSRLTKIHAEDSPQDQAPIDDEHAMTEAPNIIANPSLEGKSSQSIADEQIDPLEFPMDTEQARESRLHSEAMIGQILNEQYELVSIIGLGGMSVVYRARDRKLDRQVAVKMLLPHLMLQTQSMQRFRQEAHSSSSLNHQNIVTIHNFGEAPNGQPFLVMDLLKGKSLAALIRREKRLAFDRALNIFVQIASALSHAHQKGIIHRDLKPSNIILVEKGEQQEMVKIVDFGIAKLLPHEGRDAVQLTQTGDVFGSPLYMCPEQCKGEKLDQRADIYSLGCLMYECLTGSPPLTGDNMLEVLYRQMNEVPKSFKSIKLNQSIPHRLEAIVFKSLAKDPSQRYQSMQVVLDELVAMQEERKSSLTARFLSRLELLRLRQRPRKRSETIWLAVSVISVILLGVLSTYLASLYASADESKIFKQELTWSHPSAPPPVNIGYYAVSAYDQALIRVDRLLGGDRTFSFNEGIQQLNRIAITMEQKRHFDKAAVCYEKAAQLSDISNGPNTLPTLEIHWRLACAKFNAGDYAGSEAESIPVRQYMADHFTDQQDILRTYYTNLSEARFYQKKYAAAVDAYRDFFLSLKGYGIGWMRFTPRKIEEYIQQGKDFATTEKFALMVSHFADSLFLTGQYRECESIYEEASRRWQTLGKTDNQALALLRLSDALSRQDKDASQSYGQAISVLKQAKDKNETLLAIAEKQYADWLWRHNHFLRAVPLKLEYSRLVARIKAND